MVFAGTAQAEPTTYSGFVPNGGCEAGRTVTVSGPSRIEIEVSSTSASPNLVFGEIVAPDGKVVAEEGGSYDTPSGGTYTVRVCAHDDGISPRTLQFTATYATAPAGQPALPRTQAQGGGVLGATTALSRNVHGNGAIRTRFGLAWFSVKKSSNDLGVVKVYDPKHHKRYLFTRALIHFGPSGVTLTQGTMTLKLGQSGSRVTFRSPRYAASGKVVRGGYLIV
jgi:hypothetical protein